MINALPVLIVVWGIFTGLFLALLAYNATITRYEDNQIFLDEGNVFEQEQQISIVRKVHKAQPYIRVLGTISAILAVAIVVIYTWVCWLRLQAQ